MCWEEGRGENGRYQGLRHFKRRASICQQQSMNRTFLKIFPLILSHAKRTENTFLHSDCAGLNVTGQWVINKCLKKTKRKKEKERSSLGSSAFSFCCRTGLRGSCSSLHHPFPPPIYVGMWRSEMIKGKQDKKKKVLVQFFFIILLVKPRSFPRPSKEVHCPS